LGQASTSNGNAPGLDHLRVEYHFEETVISLHEPVVLIFSAHNGLPEPVTLNLGSGQTQFFQFSLRDPDGRPSENVRNPGENVSIVTFGSGKATIAPGADYRQRILVNQWFKFGTVGTYILTSRLTTPAETSNGSSVALPEGTAWLEVKPRDAVELKKTCAVITNQVLDTLSVEEWQFPVRMLASIDDPVAVPYLGQVLATNKGTENIVIPALERIGDDQSVEVLLSALTNKSGEVSELARQSLMRMQVRITDSKLKEAVKQALAPRVQVTSP
jgi:hypothetical protein